MRNLCYPSDMETFITLGVSFLVIGWVFLVWEVYQQFSDNYRR